MSADIFLAELALRVLREGAGAWLEDGLRLTEAEWAQFGRIIALFQQATEGEW